MSFFFNDTATTEIYTLSLHDALPIYTEKEKVNGELPPWRVLVDGVEHLASSVHIEVPTWTTEDLLPRSEEHTSELQSQFHLVCRLLLEKKNNEIKRRNFKLCVLCRHT